MKWLRERRPMTRVETPPSEGSDCPACATSGGSHENIRMAGNAGEEGQAIVDSYKSMQ